MEQVNYPMTEEMKALMELSLAFGVLKFVNYSTITNFNLAFNPLVTTRQFYEEIGKYHLIWQKLFFLLSRDREFIYKLFRPLRAKDEMINHYLSIYEKTEGRKKKDGIVFSRTDYYNDCEGIPKMTEYNLMSLGMQSNQEMFQEARKTLDYQNREQYADTRTVKAFVDTLQDFIEAKTLKGILLFVMMPDDRNFFDQKRLQIEMIRRNIKVKRVTIEQLCEFTSTDERSNLYYKQQLVSIVYYRAGYKKEQLIVKGDPEAGWRVKEKIELSNAYSLPEVEMELINMKRVQTELTKPEVIRRYLPEEEALLLERTFVQQWQFDTISEDQFKQIIKMVSFSPEKYILKPNREGGGQNLFGLDALKKLQTLSLEQCQVYILMEKIASKSVVNAIMDGVNYKEVNCLYEISRVGAFNWVDQELHKNIVAGFLIRAKPEHANEGGIMTGIGCIVPWKLVDEN